MQGEEEIDSSAPPRAAKMISSRGAQVTNGSDLIRRMLQLQELAIFAALILLCIVISLFNNAFFAPDNLLNVVRSASYVIIIGLANTFVFIMGGLDLSVGSVLGLGGLVGALCMKAGYPIWVSIGLGLSCGMVFGLFNGFAIVKLKIPSMIVTLGTMYIARGVAFVLTKGSPVYPLPESFVNLGNGDIAGVPYSVIFMIILALVASFVLNQTIFGRYVYAIGGNEETARLSGVRVDLIKICVYTLSGLAAAASGLIITSRIGSGQLSTGVGWELKVIASVIIGGTSMFGGVGTVLGSVIGALLMSVLENGLILMRVDVYWQNIVIGAIIILTVGFDQYRRTKISAQN